MKNEPSEGVGVAEVKYPSPDELEMMPHIYVHNNTLSYYKSKGWIEHPDCVSIEGYAPGYYKLMYLERKQ